jgi:hypothetical protein
MTFQVISNLICICNDDPFFVTHDSASLIKSKLTPLSKVLLEKLAVA